MLDRTDQVGPQPRALLLIIAAILETGRLSSSRIGSQLPTPSAFTCRPLRSVTSTMPKRPMAPVGTTTARLTWSQLKRRVLRRPLITRNSGSARTWIRRTRTRTHRSTPARRPRRSARRAHHRRRRPEADHDEERPANGQARLLAATTEGDGVSCLPDAHTTSLMCVTGRSNYRRRSTGRRSRGRHSRVWKHPPCRSASAQQRRYGSDAPLEGGSGGKKEKGNSRSGGTRMALFRKKKQDGNGNAQQSTSAPPREPSAGYETQQQAPSLGSGLEQRWEEAWRRARGGRRR